MRLRICEDCGSFVEVGDKVPDTTPIHCLLCYRRSLLAISIENKNEKQLNQKLKGEQ